ncbi:MAG: hypothetical protein E5X49_18415 [Mesorhizobium sp.]|uniref:hypothetical protein n=1 Tax=Mesorhizobium sp. TaxID=1871066 RepID=UPI00121C6DDE|nr:hypothetical protein [Mesorhizobium sp.]TIQ41643.1 MAG: hypothetical protein E5X49_18415 [Mesorhizobium sp.]TIW69524.1 MAG: hypothetical protein E5V60_00100 [Mesorhizobium sp.]
MTEYGQESIRGAFLKSAPKPRAREKAALQLYLFDRGNVMHRVITGTRSAYWVEKEQVQHSIDTSALLFQSSPSWGSHSNRIRLDRG